MWRESKGLRAEVAPLPRRVRSSSGDYSVGLVTETKTKNSSLNIEICSQLLEIPYYYYYYYYFSIHLFIFRTAFILMV